jgi:hypothetical protein
VKLYENGDSTYPERVEQVGGYAYVAFAGKPRSVRKKPVGFTADVKPRPKKKTSRKKR